MLRPYTIDPRGHVWMLRCWHEFCLWKDISTCLLLYVHFLTSHYDTIHCIDKLSLATCDSALNKNMNCTRWTLTPQSFLTSGFPQILEEGRAVVRTDKRGSEKEEGGPDGCFQALGSHFFVLHCSIIPVKNTAFISLWTGFLKVLSCFSFKLFLVQAIENT